MIRISYYGPNGTKSNDNLVSARPSELLRLSLSTSLHENWFGTKRWRSDPALYTILCRMRDDFHVALSQVAMAFHNTLVDMTRLNRMQAETTYRPLVVASYNKFGTSLGSLGVAALGIVRTFNTVTENWLSIRERRRILDSHPFMDVWVAESTAPVSYLNSYLYDNHCLADAFDLMLFTFVWQLLITESSQIGLKESVEETNSRKRETAYFHDISLPTELVMRVLERAEESFMEVVNEF